MKKRICLITSGHPPFDERIFWKFGVTLIENNFDVMIIASTEELHCESRGINIESFDGNNLTKKNKIERFYNYLCDFRPDIIICSEPLPILASHKFRKLKKECKIIFDITEWYPHKSHYSSYPGIKKFLRYFKYFAFNIYCTNLADNLIIGEELKANIYKYIAPLKKRIIIGYYPPKKFFNYYPVILKKGEINLCFSGMFTNERGYNRIIELTKLLSNRIPDKKINLILVGSFVDDTDVIKLNNLRERKNISIIIRAWASYDLYNSQLADADICLDLRTKTKVFDRSLPIKVFDYMASGKPVIFSNLNSFYQLPDLDKFGYIIEPDDLETAIKIIMEYIANPNTLAEHSTNARKLFEEKYNWEILEDKLLVVVNDLLNL